MERKSLKKSASGVGLAIMISRVLGLIRLQLFAFFLGATKFSDAFVVAFRIPNILRDLFIMSTFSCFSVSIPKLSPQTGAVSKVYADISFLLYYSNGLSITVKLLTETEFSGEKDPSVQWEGWSAQQTSDSSYVRRRGGKIHAVASIAKFEAGSVDIQAKLVVSPQGDARLSTLFKYEGVGALRSITPISGSYQQDVQGGYSPVGYLTIKKDY